MFDQAKLELVQKIDVILDRTKDIHGDETSVCVIAHLTKKEALVGALVISHMEVATVVAGILHSTLVDCSLYLETINAMVRKGGQEDGGSKPKKSDPSPN